VHLYIYLKNWTLKFKLLYLLNRISYFNKIYMICCLNTHIQSLKVWLKSVLPWLKYRIFYRGLSHPVYCGFRQDGTGHCAVCLGGKKVLMHTVLKWVACIVCVMRLWRYVILSVLSSKQFQHLLLPVNSSNVKNTLLVCCIYFTHILY